MVSGFIKGIIAKMILTFYQITLSHMGKMRLLKGPFELIESTKEKLNNSIKSV